MLRTRGHQVIVITERLASEKDGLRPSDDGVEIHTVPLGPPYRVRLAGAIRRLRGERGGDDAPSYGPPPTEGGVAAVARRKNGLLRRAVLSLLWFPDDELRFVRPALKLARTIMRERPIDLVYTSTPPHSTHLVGLRLRRTAGVRWVAEFRDPWTHQRSPERIEQWFGPVEAVHRWLERRCLMAADTVVTVTEGARSAIASLLPAGQRDKVVTVLNGISDMAEPAWDTSPGGPFRIVHAGTFYLDRDPRPFLQALALLRVERSFAPGELVVDFVGRGRTFGDVSIEEEVGALGLGDVVRFRDWIPRDEVDEILVGADLLLLLATSQPLQIPNKLYDYLGSRTAVLAIVDRDGESDRMLRSAGGQYVVSVAEGERASVEEILDALRAAWSAREKPSAPVNETLLRRWSVEHQMGVLADRLGA